MKDMRNPVLLSLGCAVVLVVGLSLLSLIPMLHFCSYPLVPGIAISGSIFSTVEADHLLRITVGALLINMVVYTGLFLILFGGRRKVASK